MTTPCRRCGHKLSAPSSLARGYSLRCWRLELADREREARETALRMATVPFSARQITDATALAGRLRPAGRPGLWLAPSSDGVTTYRCTALYCPCAARQPCRHQCAVIMRELAEQWKEAA